MKSQRTFEQRLTLGSPLSISLILPCLSQYRWQYAISRMQSISHSLAIDRDTHHRKREKKSVQEGPCTCTCPVFKHRSHGKNLGCNSGQALLIALLLFKNGPLSSVHICIYVLQYTPTFNTGCVHMYVLFQSLKFCLFFSGNFRLHF